MSNAQPVEVYFGNLRELMRHAETLGSPVECLSDEVETSRLLYERDALNNLAGELRCVANEVERRIRYIETVLAE